MPTESFAGDVLVTRSPSAKVWHLAGSRPGMTACGARSEGWVHRMVSELELLEELTWREWRLRCHRPACDAALQAARQAELAAQRARFSVVGS